MTTIVPTPPADVRGSTAGRDPAPRIHYFDWLRAIAVFGVITYHTLLPFARSTWLIRTADQSDLLLAVVSLFETFGLSVLFLIAGASALVALRRRPWRAFLAERAKRLLVPFVVGALVVVPSTGYITGLHLGTTSGSFLTYLIEYPRTVWSWVTEFGLSPQLITYVGAHLWFLAWLFICSALALPIFAFLSSYAGRSFLDAVGRLARWRGATLLLAVPITLPGLILAGLSSAEQGPSLEAYAWFAVIFVVGYLLFSDHRFITAVRRDLVLALIVALLGSFALLAAGSVQGGDTPRTFGASYFLMMSLVGITGWAWTLTVLGIGMRAAFMQRLLPALAAEAALPAYVLHFPIVTAISSLVVQSPLEFVVKIVANALLGVGASLVVTAALLRISVLRPLLGLRRIRPSVVQP